MITLTDQERRLAYSLINDLYQNWNYRSLEGSLLESILNKLQSVSVSFNSTESRRLQYHFRGVAERYVKFADQNIQFILQENRGVIKEQNNFFDGPAMFNTCQSILDKLEKEHIV